MVRHTMGMMLAAVAINTLSVSCFAASVSVYSRHHVR